MLVFGNTTQAVSAILTGFFGGMAIGAAVGGRVADRVRSPLRMYGIMEIALVVIVVVTPISFGLIQEVYRGIYPSLEGSPQALALVRLVLAVAALAPGHDPHGRHVPEPHAPSGPHRVRSAGPSVGCTRPTRSVPSSGHWPPA